MSHGITFKCRNKALHSNSAEKWAIESFSIILIFMCDAWKKMPRASWNLSKIAQGRKIKYRLLGFVCSNFTYDLLLESFELKIISRLQILRRSVPTFSWTDSIDMGGESDWQYAQNSKNPEEHTKIHKKHKRNSFQKEILSVSLFRWMNNFPALCHVLTNDASFGTMFLVLYLSFSTIQ